MTLLSIFSNKSNFKAEVYKAVHKTSTFMIMVKWSHEVTSEYF